MVMALEGVLSLQAGQNPRIIEEKLKAMVGEDAVQYWQGLNASPSYEKALEIIEEQKKQIEFLKSQLPERSE
jgi:flagellar motor component MotA